MYLYMINSTDDKSPWTLHKIVDCYIAADRRGDPCLAVEFPVDNEGFPAYKYYYFEGGLSEVNDMFLDSDGEIVAIRRGDD